MLQRLRVSFDSRTTSVDASVTWIPPPYRATFSSISEFRMVSVAPCHTTKPPPNRHSTTGRGSLPAGLPPLRAIIESRTVAVEPPSTTIAAPHAARLLRKWQRSHVSVAPEMI